MWAMRVSTLLLVAPGALADTNNNGPTIELNLNDAMFAQVKPSGDAEPRRVDFKKGALRHPSSMRSQGANNDSGSDDDSVLKGSKKSFNLDASRSTQPDADSVADLSAAPLQSSVHFSSSSPSHSKQSRTANAANDAWGMKAAEVLKTLEGAPDWRERLPILCAAKTPAQHAVLEFLLERPEAEKGTEISKPIRSVHMGKITGIWSANHIDKLAEKSNKDLFEYIMLANMLREALKPGSQQHSDLALTASDENSVDEVSTDDGGRAQDCKEMLYLGCAKVATKIKGKSPEEIKQILSA